MEYIISAGTNIGDRMDNLKKCEASINLVPKTQVIKKSFIYETSPVGYAQQDNFYNVIFLVDSQLEPHEMLGVCLGIEAGFGRERGIINGPRILDLDVIFAEDLRINTKNLTVPHPRFMERRFILEPLLDIFPQGECFAINFKKYIDKIQGQDIVKLDI